MVAVDETSSTVLFTELKWIRKPMFNKERARADREFLYGLEQLARLRRFLDQNPSYLVNRGAIQKPITEYTNVHYALAGRDHLVWSDPPADTFIISFDALKAALAETDDLKKSIEDLKQYDWLPVEGIDFEVKETSAVVNGITISGGSFRTL